MQAHIYNPSSTPVMRWDAETMGRLACEAVAEETLSNKAEGEDQALRLPLTSTHVL